MQLEKDQVTETVLQTAQMICAEQPEVSAPESIRDLDSFSFVQIVLELENTYNLKLLESLDGFEGETFGDLADVIVKHAANTAASPTLASQGEEA